ncbi:MAG TPA: HIT family protein [Candidatus Cybelea sp.]|nr:HIT family protein [Candidatus Cybelea sp.]
MNNDPNCIFCKIVTGAVPCFKLHEDSSTLAFMDINPFNPGHCLVIPKSHAADVFTIDEASMAATARSARVVATAVQATLKCEGMNLVQANGPAAAQSVKHFHIHVLPRRTGDEAKLNWMPSPGDMTAIGKLAEAIRRHITK